MPRRRLEFLPGVTAEATADAARGTWWQSNLIRFFVDPATKRIYPQKIGGWTHIGVLLFPGLERGIHYWTDLLKRNWYAHGTQNQLYVQEYPGSVSDITPAAFSPGQASSPPNPLFTLLIWTLDNWGEDLIACASGQRIYLWIPPPISTAPAHAGVLAGSPVHNQGIFVSNQLQIIIAYGSSLDGGELDPMLIRWCDQSDFNDWAASTVNQAGSYRIPRGSKVISGMSSIVGNLLWTDLDLWNVQYLGFPLVFGFSQVGLNCGIIGQKARGALYGVIYWMSDHNFFKYGPGGGGAQVIPCSVWDFVFKDLDTGNQDKCWVGTNAPFNEIWFFFPSKSGGTGEIDSYAKINVIAEVWDCGRLPRTAGTDDNKPGGPTWAAPPTTDPVSNTIIYQHEFGNDADGEAMEGVMLRSGMLDVDDGEYLGAFQEFIPDFDWAGSTADVPSIEVSLYIEDMPADPPTLIETFEVNPITRYENPRGRGLGIAIQINCDTLGTAWRYGSPRLRYARDGKLS